MGKDSSAMEARWLRDAESGADGSAVCTVGGQHHHAKPTTESKPSAETAGMDTDAGWSEKSVLREVFNRINGVTAGSAEESPSGRWVRLLTIQSVPVGPPSPSLAKYCYHPEEQDAG